MNPCYQQLSQSLGSVGTVVGLTDGSVLEHKSSLHVICNMFRKLDTAGTTSQIAECVINSEATKEYCTFKHVVNATLD